MGFQRTHRATSHWARAPPLDEGEDDDDDDSALSEQETNIADPGDSSHTPP